MSPDKASYVFYATEFIYEDETQMFKASLRASHVRFSQGWNCEYTQFKLLAHQNAEFHPLASGDGEAHRSGEIMSTCR